MDLEAITQDLKSKGETTVGRLRDELLSIRTGKPNPGLIEDLVINAYGESTKLKLKELASITTEPPQSLVIAPFDFSIIKDIENGILSSQLNITPSTQGNVIRVIFPPLTEDQRTQMTRLVSSKVEEYKETLRVARDEARRRIKTLFDNKQITEDDKFKAFEKVDKTAKELTETIESIKTRKQAELMTV
ncbi:hypothetical protein A2690_04595 [Candidatus Roizmanbacteria bacterium RIFCSPHIGHO2_01_FULL_39_12b]|uniref:Ribosome recycling factor domain-containing protein n=1 Tax=Candidatus Roizmanbacteria bacterium RIFCSPHIGHO2_01_FULL_39_12b TaxID=1802030 RepID=A0A1F7G7P1_9BACT|nr:MAG: hypothetical protein A2690_04595 [Candidatus Roizmanbacteria bacterium RIFCSPHIGHO2_01_FULL_39_12b]